MHTSIGSSVGRIKQPGAPSRLLFEMEELTIFIGHSPANRTSAQIQSNTVLT